jgi:acyl-CoA thioester hydrolase
MESSSEPPQMQPSSNTPEPANLPPVKREFEFQLRVRYRETDAQGRVHHSNYLNYFEVARVEMLRASGRNYKDVEAAGIYLVVTKAVCNYHRGAVYDDLLTIRTKVVAAKRVRITHEYQIFIGDELIADGSTVVAAVAPDGKVARLPEWLRLDV